MRYPTSSLPALVLSERPGQGRVAYLPADVDRCFGREHLPDHAMLLANIVRWAARDRLPLRVAGPGLLDCHLYRQDDRLVLHLVNLTYADTACPPITELLPVGPYVVQVQLPAAVAAGSARLLAAERDVEVTVQDGWAHLTIPSITDHEVVVIR
jgi:hypothetical protein